MQVAARKKEGFAPVTRADLYYRDVGEGQAIVVVHGGPDFDHTYLLPDLDRLATGYRLVYYDQRCRGRSRGALDLEDIHIGRYVEDLEGVRKHLGLDSIAVLGHSWGGVVAMHYALAHPERVSHLVLMNCGPASHADLQLMRAERLRRRAAHEARLTAIMPAYARGDPEAVTDYYRIDFGTTFRRLEDLERLNLHWSRESIRTGRAIESQLMQGLVWTEGYTLLPELPAIRAATLVIHGEHDFIALEGSRRIADAIPGARLAVLPDSGHFSYVDAPDQVRHALDRFFAAGAPSAERG